VSWLLPWILFSLGVALGLAIGMQVHRARLRGADRKTCPEDLLGCKAFAWEHCCDGRCRYHCMARCQCVPRVAPGKLHAIDGGRS
jgi:hypothetical protein